MQSELAIRLRDERERQGLSREKLGVLVGMTAYTVYRAENGKASRWSVFKIARGLGLKLSLDEITEHYEAAS